MKLLETLQVDGAVTPETNNTYDLGSPSLSWATIYAATDIQVGGSSVWTSGNDGSGSGLDADLLDGIDSTDFARLSTVIPSFATSIEVKGHTTSAGTDFGGYRSAGTNIILHGDTTGVSGIFFQSDKNDGATNINTPSDYGFIQYHAYGIDGTSGESNRLVIGVANDSTDKLVLQSPYKGGVVVTYQDATSGTAHPEYVVWHEGNDGSGSGLDADLLDGQQGSYYTDIVSRLGYTPINKAGDTGIGNLSMSQAEVQLPANTFDATADISSYPLGYSVMWLQNVQSAAGWPFTGYGWVITYNFGTHGYQEVVQMYTGTSSSAPNSPRWYRSERDSNSFWQPFTRVWTGDQDGAGSGLDADLLDGQQGAYYLAWANLTGVPSSFTPSAHVLASTTGLGADHTVSGLTAGQVLRATGATTAAFQSLSASDIPSLDASKITTGTFNISRIPTITAAKGGTGLTSYTAGNYINAATTTSLQQRTPAQVLSDIGALASSAYTASDVLSKLLTVDGAGSSLDADLLDGQQGSYYTNIVARLGYTPVNKAGDTITGVLHLTNTDVSVQNNIDFNIVPTMPTTAGLYLGWNRSGGDGEGNLLVSKGGGGGATVLRVYTIDPSTGNTTETMQLTPSGLKVGTALDSVYSTGNAPSLAALSDTTISTPTNGQVLVYNGTSWVNAAATGGGSGTTLQDNITQTSHGFVVGDVIGYNGSAYFKADATTDANAEVVGIVSVVADANNFTLVTGGYISTLTGLTAGTTYFLSNTPGVISAVAGTVNKPILIADSTTSGYFYNFRGISPTFLSTSGFMDKAVYDTNNNGIVDAAQEINDGAGTIITPSQIFTPSNPPSVAQLLDTTITGAASGEVLSYNGSNWINSSILGAEGFITTNTSSASNLYAKVADFTFTSQYQDYAAQLKVLSSHEGASDSTLSALLTFRIRQQSALGSAPVIDFWFQQNGIYTAVSANDFNLVITTNTVSQTVVELWVKIQQTYQQYYFQKIVETTTASSWNYYSNQTLQSALPTGTATTAQRDYITAGVLTATKNLDPAQLSTLPTANGIYFGWNRNAGAGEGDILVSSGAGTGTTIASVHSINTSTGATTEAFRINPSDILVNSNGLTSVVASGSNSNGNWVRYYDGTQICWREVATTGLTVSSIGRQGITIYYYVAGAWTYPATFSATPSIHATPNMSGVGKEYSTYFGGGGTTSSSPSLVVESILSFTSYDVFQVATGRWY